MKSNITNPYSVIIYTSNCMLVQFAFFVDPKVYQKGQSLLKKLGVKGFRKANVKGILRFSSK